MSLYLHLPLAYSKRTKIFCVRSFVHFRALLAIPCDDGSSLLRKLELHLNYSRLSFVRLLILRYIFIIETTWYKSVKEKESD